MESEITIYRNRYFLACILTVMRGKFRLLIFDCRHRIFRRNHDVSVEVRQAIEKNMAKDSPQRVLLQEALLVYRSSRNRDIEYKLRNRCVRKQKAK